MVIQRPSGTVHAPARSTPLELAHDGLVYRPLATTGGEPEAMVELQAEIWNTDVATPAHQLIAAASCGGVVVGAFHDDRPVGLSYGFAAHRAGRVWLHSHQTGVLQPWRDRGVGATLKWLQRSVSLSLGYDTITWTFDPLRARNAYFNFGKLGATASSYKVDYYGPMDDPHTPDTSTDRLWVEWDLTAAAVEARFAAYCQATGIRGFVAHDAAASGDGAPVAVGDSGAAPVDLIETDAAAPGVRVPVAGPVLDAGGEWLRLEVPADVGRAEQAWGKAEMTAWRMTVRQAFMAAFERGYVTTGFLTSVTDEGRRSWYLLRSAER